MGTNEYEQPATPSGSLITIVRATHEVTGTDSRLNLRLLIAMLLIGITGSSAPMPYLLVFCGALVLASIEVARLAWKK